MTPYGIGVIFIIVLKGRFVERRKPKKLQSRFSRENENVTYRYTFLLLSHQQVFSCFSKSVQLFFQNQLDIYS